jgi:hypothetical protein
MRSSTVRLPSGCRANVLSIHRASDVCVHRYSWTLDTDPLTAEDKVLQYTSDLERPAA